MKKLILNYKYSLIGFIISLGGYLVCLFLDLDISEQINTYLSHLENFEIDELFAVWLKLFLIFVIINYIILIGKRKNQQKLKIYKSMLYACNHILKNFLYQTKILELEAEQNNTFDKKVIEMYLKSRNEAVILIKKLSEIKQIKEEDIHKAIDAQIDNNQTQQSMDNCLF